MFIACVGAFTAPTEQAKREPTARILYAKREIPKDSILNPADVEDRETPQSKIAQGVLSKEDMPNLPGRRVRFGITAGQMIGNHDFDPPPWGLSRLRSV